MYQALRSASVSLQQLLTERIKADTFLYAPASPFRARSMAVLLNTPKEMDDDGKEGISLWLYRVRRDDQRLNDPPVRVNATQVRPAPLPLRLHYLVTPLTSRDSAGDPETEQYLLGKVMQCFHSTPILSGTALEGELRGSAAELHVRLETLGLEEIAHVWQALEGSYLLSASYEVSVVNVDSALEPRRVSPVEEFLPQVGLITEAG